MTISAIAEPAMMLAVFTVALGAGSTNLSDMAQAAMGQSWRFLAPSQMLAFAALFIVLIAETGRIPVDNPATHLELTMIHEAMILEYSGPYLALIEWSAAMKQLVLMTLLVNVFFPFGLSPMWSPLGTTAEPGAVCWQAAGARLRGGPDGDHQRQTAPVSRSGTAGGGVRAERAGTDFDISVLRMKRCMLFWHDPQFGNRMITLMAALVLVLQIAMVAQRWLITNIRVFARAVVSAGRDRQHHRVFQPRAAHLRRRRAHSCSSKASCCRCSGSGW